MVMVVNSGRWCLGEELRIHMLSQWLISHHVRGVAWRSPQGSWLD